MYVRDSNENCGTCMVLQIKTSLQDALLISILFVLIKINQISLRQFRIITEHVFIFLSNNAMKKCQLNDLNKKLKTIPTKSGDFEKSQIINKFSQS